MLSTQQMRHVYVYGLLGVEESYSVACSEDTPWVRIAQVQLEEEDYPEPILKLLVKVDTAILAAEQTYS